MKKQLGLMKIKHPPAPKIFGFFFPSNVMLIDKQAEGGEWLKEALGATLK